VSTVPRHGGNASGGPPHPRTESAAEVGVGTGAGHNVNAELGRGGGIRAYEAAVTQVIRPILDQYRPDLIVGACGQDASGFDPNGRQNLLMAGFRRVGRLVAEAADELCDVKLVLVQEGGYARTYAAYCLHATLEGVLGTGPLLADPIGYLPDDAGRGDRDIAALRTYLSPFWRLP